MTNKAICLVQRVAVVIICLLLSQSFHYSQTLNNETPPPVVKLRLSLDLKKPRQITFSPVSKLLAVQRGDGSIQILDITDGREQAVLPLADKELYDMEWTSDGLRLLVTSSKSAAIWDARSGTRLSTAIEIQGKKHIWFFGEVKLSADEKFLINVKQDSSFKARVFGWEKPTVQVWSLESGKLKLETRLKGTYSYAELSSTGKQVLTRSEDEDPKLWDVETGRLFARLKPPQPAIFREGSDARFTPDGRFVIQTHETGTYIWHSSSGVINVRIPFNKDSSDSILEGFSPDGKMFVTSQQRGGRHPRASIDFRDCETGELRATLTAPKWDGWPNQIVWSDDGRTLVAASGYSKYEARVWDAGTGRFKATFPMLLTYSRIPLDFGFKDRDQLTIHPTLPIVSAGSNKFIRLWNAETGELLQKLDNTEGSGKWSADGTLFLTFTKDRESAQVWDVVMGPASQSRPRWVQRDRSNLEK